jgi:hypothetical protein
MNESIIFVIYCGNWIVNCQQTFFVGNLFVMSNEKLHIDHLTRKIKQKI